MRVCGEIFKILEMFTLSVTMGDVDIVAENMFVVQVDVSFCRYVYSILIYYL